MFFVYSEASAFYFQDDQGDRDGEEVVRGTLHGEVGEVILNVFVQKDEVVKHQHDFPKVGNGEGGVHLFSRWHASSRAQNYS